MMWYIRHATFPRILGIPREQVLISENVLTFSEAVYAFKQKKLHQNLLIRSKVMKENVSNYLENLSSPISCTPISLFTSFSSINTLSPPFSQGVCPQTPFLAPLPRGSASFQRNQNFACGMPVYAVFCRNYIFEPIDLKICFHVTQRLYIMCTRSGPNCFISFLFF